MVVPVDEKTGQVTQRAMDKEKNIYPVHPYTGNAIEGFRFPDWDKAMDMVKRAALEVPGVGFVGWDVAFTDEGPILIEGNRRPGYDLVQVLSDCGRKDIMRSCLEDINAAEGTNYKL